jgi:hypothetical protein
MDGNVVQLNEYKQFVLSSSEKEGHISFFLKRQALWDKELFVDQILSELSELYVKLQTKRQAMGQSDINMTV